MRGNHSQKMPSLSFIVKYLVLNLDPKLGCPVSCTAVVG